MRRVIEARDADTVAGALDGRHVDAAGWADGEVSAIDGATVERAPRQDRALDRRRLEALSDERVNDVLDFDAPNVGEPARIEHRQHVQPRGRSWLRSDAHLYACPERVRIVPARAPSSHSAAGLTDSDRLGGAQRAPPDRSRDVLAPTTRG